MKATSLKMYLGSYSNHKQIPFQEPKCSCILWFVKVNKIHFYILGLPLCGSSSFPTLKNLLFGGYFSFSVVLSSPKHLYTPQLIVD